MSLPKAVVRQADMDSAEIDFFINTAMQALETCPTEQAIATYLKHQVQKRTDSTGGSAAWHVVVGRNFASNLTHESDHYLYFYVGQTGFLVWRTP
ncbi:dynein light chain cytoplasmic-like [Cystoisospora suis]|uniref:Dynein light chain n=1 Tax=Cystoisospora suis TaxID=483139 RepID=A0A2C6KEY4_9APIC|nr:dynein light chain cytoplasmic-like [Cystoisospora suis]